MSIVSKIIHEHNGQIFYDNRNDLEGAFVTIILPKLNEKNLIVDDEKDIRFILNEILTENQYTVVSAGTIKEAESIINNDHFDLALLDVLLDEKSRDGLYLLNQIKKNKDIPVIMMSGHANIQIAVNSVKDGAFEFF